MGTCKKYKPSLSGRVMDENQITQANKEKEKSIFFGGVLTSLLPNEQIVILCNVLIRKNFVLITSDLEELYQNSKSFHHEQDMVQWTKNMRPC